MPGRNKTPEKRYSKDDLAPERRPWEKQPWETAPAFEAFAIYRDLGLTRSLSKAATALKEGSTRSGNVNSIRSQMSDWSGANVWQYRVDTYDMHVDERMREQREGQISRQNRRYESAAATLSAGILARIALNPDEVGEHRGNLLRPVDLNELDAEAVARVLVNLQRVERLATGQPTELAKGAFLISSTDVAKICAELVELALPFIPEERQPLYAQVVQSFAQGERRQLAAA